MTFLIRDILLTEAEAAGFAAHTNTRRAELRRAAEAGQFAQDCRNRHARAGGTIQSEIDAADRQFVQQDSYDPDLQSPPGEMSVQTPRFRKTFLASVVLSLVVGNALATSPQQEDWAAARKATCPELIDAYKVTSNAERQVVAAIKESRNGAVASNVLGVATLAVFGIGFFTWDDNASAEENLADLRHDLNIITTVAAEKKCVLPASTDSKK